MRSRRLLLVCVAALTVASCSRSEPTVVSEAPGSTSATDLTAPAGTPGAPGKPGRFIARCATEAEGGGVPGETIFTDGSEGVTDHCLRRYYTGMQPDPGSVYVPDDETGSRAPAASATPVGTHGTSGAWTPAQPRTDDTQGASPFADRRVVTDTRTGQQDLAPQQAGTPDQQTVQSPTGGGVLPSRVTPPGEDPTAPSPQQPGTGATNPGATPTPTVPGAPAPVESGTGGTTPGGGTVPGEAPVVTGGAAPTTGSGSSPSVGGSVPTVVETVVPTAGSGPVTSVTATAPAQPMGAVASAPGYAATTN